MKNPNQTQQAAIALFVALSGISADRVVQCEVKKAFVDLFISPASLHVYNVADWAAKVAKAVGRGKIDRHTNHNGEQLTIEWENKAGTKFRIGVYARWIGSDTELSFYEFKDAEIVPMSLTNIRQITSVIEAAEVTDDQPVSNGYTEKQLHACFDQVKDPENWKNPINKVIDNPGEKNIACLREAVQFFTGGEATFYHVAGNKLRVRADGYYASVPG